MAQLTIQIPDELAQQLEPLQDQLPAMLAQLATDSSRSSSLEISSYLSASAETVPAYAEVLDLLTAQPSPDKIVAFKVSTTAQQRLRDLLAKNRAGSLSNAEVAELDLYEQLDHLMMLLKARASRLIASNP